MPLLKVTVMLAFAFGVAVWMDLFNFSSLSSLFGCDGLFRIYSLLVVFFYFSPSSTEENEVISVHLCSQVCFP
jgi:hypothetical protein